MPLIATEGYAAQEVGSIYGRARTLCERLGSTPELSQVLWGLWTFHAVKAELSAALGIAGELLRLADGMPHVGTAMRAHWAMQVTRTHQGDFHLALEHFDKALALDGSHRGHDDFFVDAVEPGVAMRCFAGWCLWFVGQPDRALLRMQEALTLARELSEPHGLAHALVFAAVLHQLRGERSTAQQCADEAVTLAGEHGLLLYGAAARIVHGWALVGRGDDEEAVEQIRQGLAAWQSTGAQLMRPYYLSLLAEAYASMNRHSDALQILDEALALAASTGEHMYEAELRRLRDQYVLALPARRP